MDTLNRLLDNNRRWAEQIGKEQPGFFEQLAEQQSPEYLWIGCSDSRVPASEILGLPPGGIFVHRNIANIVALDDPNCLSVIQYAVEALKVKHIVVCGHYGCGGVNAAITSDTHGRINAWLEHIREVYKTCREELDAIDDSTLRMDRLCELNVIEQVAHVCKTDIVSEAWQSGAALSVHGWMYRLDNGLLHDLGITAAGH